MIKFESLGNEKSFSNEIISNLIICEGLSFGEEKEK